jgi:glutathione S-transferase
MITVHHLNNSRSQRVIWLLEELGVDYEIKRYERDAQTMLAPKSLLKVHPLGKSPVITDDAHGHVTVAESGAIIEYLIDRYDIEAKLAPAAGTPTRLRYTYWLHFAEGSAMSPLLMKLVFNHIEKAPMPFFAKPIAKAIAKKTKASFIDPQIKAHLDFIEAELHKSTWFAGGRLTGADIQMSFPLEAALARGGLDESYPKIMAFLKRIHARAGYKRALERGGEYNLLT